MEAMNKQELSKDHLNRSKTGQEFFFGQETLKI